MGLGAVARHEAGVATLLFHELSARAHLVCGNLLGGATLLSKVGYGRARPLERVGLHADERGVGRKVVLYPQTRGKAVLCLVGLGNHLVELRLSLAQGLLLVVIQFD